MKLHRPAFSKEWKRQLIGGAVVGGIYILIAIFTGLSEAVSRTGFPPFGTVFGVFIGCIYLVVNTLLLDLTTQRIASRTHPQRFYAQSYLVRYLLAGVVLFLGFLFLDPFAVFVTLLSPKITYFFCAVCGKGME